MDFQAISEKIQSEFTREELKYYDQIIPFENIHLASMGSNDTEGYQVFTPEFIVSGMVKSVGEDVVFDNTKTILEPTSGDGAFTVYILLHRLYKYLKEDSNSFEINALKSLSTIYSVEMDKELLLKQRNNILTAFITFAADNHISWSEGFIELVKCIILKNFIWGMFNSDNEIDAGIFGSEVVYKMPEAEKGNLKPLDMPVWDISKDGVSVHEEGVELW